MKLILLESLTFFYIKLLAFDNKFSRYMGRHQNWQEQSNPSFNFLLDYDYKIEIILLRLYMSLSNSACNPFN